MTAFSLDSSGRRTVAVACGAAGLVLGFALAALLKDAVATQVIGELPWWVNLPGPLAIAGTAYVVFEKWMWRWTPFRQMSGVPDLNGAWTAEIRSSHDDHKLVHKGTLRIVHTWSRIVIEMETAKSTSRSTCAAMFLERGATVELEYGYKNTPKAEATATMQASTGFAVLALKGPNELAGDYFTGRGRERHGSLRLLRMNEVQR